MKGKVDNKGPDYLSIVENSPDYIIRYNREFRHIYLNHAALRLIGASNQQIIGKTHRESGLYDQSECDYWEGKIRYVFKTGSLYQEQFDWQSQDTLMWLDRRLTPEYDESGNIISVLAVSHDITKLIEAEQAYRETSK